MLVIRILRSIKNISQRDLARRLGVSAATWHRIERGLRPIDSHLLPRLADTLSVTPEELAACLRDRWGTRR